MRLNKLAVFIIGILLLTAAFAEANSLNGGRGLMYIRSAWVMEPGYLTLYSHTRFFGKVGQITSIGQAPSAVTFWDVQGTLSLNYGISERFELGITPIMYQDNHKGDKGYNFPDDLFLNLKIGSFGAKGSSLKYGLLLYSRFPTGEYHNVPFAPYSAGKPEWGFMGLTTYAQDPLYPDESLNLHLNFGYIYHNDVGEKLSQQPDDVDTIKVLHPSQELLYGFGLNLPTERFNYSLELYGNVMVQNPPETAYSRENYLYLSPGITYKPYRWLSLDFAADFLLSSADKDETAYDIVHKIPDMPNYPTWRVNLGLKMILLPTSVYRVNERDILMRKAESRRELFEQIIREQRETESAEEELERIKEERRKAERELERLRRILEGEVKKKKAEAEKVEAEEKPQPEEPKEPEEPQKTPEEPPKGL